VCRVKTGLHAQLGSIDFCLRTQSGKVCQLFRLRSDSTKRAGGENGFFQDEKGGFAVPYGTVMVSNFLIEHNLSQVRDDLKKLFSKIYSGCELEFDEWFKGLEESFGRDIKRLQRIERLTLYSTIRYIIRDFGEKRQRTLRKRLNIKYSLR
jgi:hypothetical protein